MGFLAGNSCGDCCGHSRLGAQEQRTKARIFNAGYTITASPLLAAKEWESFTAKGFEWSLF
jgi:hypothetical protein